MLELNRRSAFMFGRVLGHNLRRSLALLVIFGVAVMVSACGSDVSSETQQSPIAEADTAMDSADAPQADIGAEEVDPPIKDVPITDKQAVIRYTKENQRLGGHLGTAGGVTGLVPMDTSALSEAEANALAQARTVLANYLEIPDADAAELVEISKQQWPNASLGCGQPGEMSAQVITPGYKVVLVLSGLRHQVHTGRRGGRVCERLQGMLQAPRRALTLSALPRLQREAIADLAAKLAVAESEITPGRVAPGSWPDASLGCPEPGVEYAQVVTGGYFLPMVFRGRTVQYRTDGKRVVVCEGLELLIPQDK